MNTLYFCSSSTKLAVYSFQLKEDGSIDVASIAVHIAMRKAIFFCAELYAIIVFV